MERKIFIDNLRYGTIVIVIVFHIAYQFNSVGISRDVNIQGISQLDLIEYIVYPWFMVFLFLIAGISARYALHKRSSKEFLKERICKILIPSIAWIFFAGWSVCIVHNHYGNMFAYQEIFIPWYKKYLFYCKYGIGPTWFCHELFLASLLLVLIRKLDKKDRIWKWGGVLKIYSFTVSGFYCLGKQSYFERTGFVCL